jgi:hypothetical protein
MSVHNGFYLLNFGPKDYRCGYHGILPRFSEGVVPEADEWVRKNFEDMREALEPAA